MIHERGTGVGSGVGVLDGTGCVGVPVNNCVIVGGAGSKGVGVSLGGEETADGMGLFVRLVFWQAPTDNANAESFRKSRREMGTLGYLG